ncbi:MAG TPA: response regulator [Cytophagaceae bacterium]|jgi:CheY-like chemotaxis protein|nr:response regulator [Cytophagaceae bacterium]
MGYIDYCLIVDNDTDRRNELKKVISNAGLVKEVMAALNCGHGLLYLNQSLSKIYGKQGLVILNGKTPIMGGFEFLQELHKGEFKHDKEKLRIVVISNDLTDEEEKNYKAKGVNDFLPSCCSDETFSATLKKIFSKPVVRKTKANAGDSDDNQVYMLPNNNTQVG